MSTTDTVSTSEEISNEVASPFVVPEVSELVFPHPYNWDLSGIQVSIETITAKQAGELLRGGNVKNRHLSEKHVNKLLGIIQRGHWQFNGIPVVFDRDGNLVEGQHRLAGIEKAGIAMEVLIVRGVDPAAFRTYDLCKRRTLKDAIDAGETLTDNESSSVLAAAIGYATAYTEKRLFILSACLEDERVSFFDDHQGIRDFAQLYKGRNGLRLSSGLLAACHYLFAQKNREDADQFMKDVVGGEVIDEVKIQLGDIVNGSISSRSAGRLS